MSPDPHRQDEDTARFALALALATTLFLAVFGAWAHRVGLTVLATGILAAWMGWTVYRR